MFRAKAFIDARGNRVTRRLTRRERDRLLDEHLSRREDWIEAAVGGSESSEAASRDATSMPAQPRSWPERVSIVTTAAFATVLAMGGGVGALAGGVAGAIAVLAAPAYVVSLWTGYPFARCAGVTLVIIVIAAVIVHAMRGPPRVDEALFACGLCSACGYDISGLVQQRDAAGIVTCPECGAAWEVKKKIASLRECPSCNATFVGKTVGADGFITCECGQKYCLVHELAMNDD
jgi:predicted nucleic acid-binding Zn ribbon protein